LRHGAWMVPPIRIHRLSPSPDLDAKFTAQPDFQERVQSFVDEIGNNFPLSPRRQSDPPTPQPPGQQEEAAVSPPRETAGDPLGSPIISLRQTPTSVAPTESSGRRPLFQVNLNLCRTRSQPAPDTPTTSRSNSPPSTGEENIPPTSPKRVRPSHPCGFKSRPKRKCTFGPLKHSADRTQAPPGIQRSLSTDSQYLDDLLREIDAACQADQPSTSYITGTSNAANAQEQERGTYPTTAGRRSSRPKVKCRFGPYSRLHRRHHPAPQADDSPARPPLPCQQALIPSDSRAATPIGPFLDRMTLTPPTLRSGTPFARYYHMVPEAPRLNPNRFALARMGITEETLQLRVSQEASEAL
jgi:hypothetical protein